MNLELLLAPKGDDAPSGKNLEYGPTFRDLEIAATPGKESQAGGSTIPAEDPDYKEVDRLALEVLEQSHDIRAAVYKANAQLNLTGLPGFADCLAFIHGCLEQHWDTCHPGLDEDEGDPMMRVNATLSLREPTTVLRSLRLVPLTDSRMFGRLSLRDMLIADGEMAAPEDMENIPDSASVSAAIKDTDEEKMSATFAAAQRALSLIKGINDIYDEKVPGQGPSLDPLNDMLAKIVQRLGSELGDASGAESGGDSGEDGFDDAPSSAPDTASAAPAATGPSGGGAIKNTNDVKNAIDRIIEYYRRTEPSSPVPIILHRARKLVDADFMDILKDMVPDSVEEIQRLGGIEVEEEEY